jgi:hypothetical protein
MSSTNASMTGRPVLSGSGASAAAALLASPIRSAARGPGGVGGAATGAAFPRAGSRGSASTISGGAGGGGDAMRLAHGVPLAADAPNPFVLPADTDVLRMRETERLAKDQVRRVREWDLKGG